jgi:hypothetical protein
MKQYLLSMYQPTGGVPQPAVLAAIMKDVHAIRQELQSSGQYGGHPTVANRRNAAESRRVAHHDGAP